MKKASWICYTLITYITLFQLVQHVLPARNTHVLMVTALTSPTGMMGLMIAWITVMKVTILHYNVLLYWNK